MHLGKMGTDASGWIGGAWNWGLTVAIGYATTGLDEPHRHERTTEIYLVAAGSSIAVVDGVEIEIEAGDVLAVEPHEVRSFTASSDDYRCFVLHVGGDGTSDRVPAS
jgi:mannose-6-phosphate isomerase-like protein (cupin superfamily)